MRISAKQITIIYNEVLKFCKKPRTVKEVAEAFNISMNCANLRMINFYTTGLVIKHENKFRWVGEKYKYKNRVYMKNVMGW